MSTSGSERRGTGPLFPAPVMFMGSGLSPSASPACDPAIHSAVRPLPALPVHGRAQGAVDARLPARSLRLEVLDDVAVEAETHEPLRGRFLRAAGALSQRGVKLGRQDFARRTELSQLLVREFRVVADLVPILW